MIGFVPFCRPNRSAKTISRINTYYIFDDSLLYHGRLGSSAMHYHHYLQFGFSPEPSFRLRTKKQDFGYVNSFFIPADTPHELRLKGNAPVILFWLDPEYQRQQTVPLYDEIITPLSNLNTKLAGLALQPLNCESARTVRSLITGKSPLSLKKLDSRIAETINRITQELTSQTITAEYLASEAYLSPSRFMHLFSDEVGIPVRKYILWQRLRHTLIQMAEGKSITEAAISAGFTDSSHMNRNFNAMFGITPSKIFKNSRFVQVFAC